MWGSIEEESEDLADRQVGGARLSHRHAQQDEAELADLQLVAVVTVQQCPVDTLLVDVGAVERTLIANDVAVVGVLDGDVSAATP